MISGKDNIVADALSRRPNEMKDVDPMSGRFPIEASTGTPFKAVSEFGVKIVAATLPDREELVKAANADLVRRSVLRALVTGHSEEVEREMRSSDGFRSIWQHRELISVSNGLFKIKNFRNLKKEKIIVPDSLRERVIRYYHSGLAGAHQGRDAVIERISRRFW